MCLSVPQLVSKLVHLEQQCGSFYTLSTYGLFLSPLLCRKVMSAPNLLRVGTPENIFVECQDCTDENDIRVEIRVRNYPTRAKMLASTSVTLNSTNKFQGFKQIQVM